MVQKKNCKVPFTPTGDPFVDGGGLALEFWSGQYPDKTVMDLIEDVATIYVKKWKTKINALFLNSKITNPSVDSKAKVKETVKLYTNMWENEKSAPHEPCRICGEEELLHVLGRDQFCLAGSGPFANFHHAHEEGLLVCKYCATKLFFLPLAVMYLGGNLGLLQLSDENTKAFWLKTTVQENYAKVGKNKSEGILKSVYTNPVNAVFYFAAELIGQIKRKNTGSCLQLYHFSNFGASPECNLYVLPHNLFEFLYNVQKQNISRLWKAFIKTHYRLKKDFSWDIHTGEWLETKNQRTVADTEYLNFNNSVFTKLLNGKSILPDLRRFLKKLYIHNNPLFNSLLVIHYAEEVLNMQKEQIIYLKELGTKIFNIAREENNFNKYLVLLEKAGKAYQLRYALIKLMKKNYNLGVQEPLIRLDDYLNYLFPDGQFWGEVRDLLLIFLYEKMHEANIKCESIQDENQEPLVETEEF